MNKIYRTIKNIALASTFMLLAPSCSNFLNVDPSGTITQEVMFRDIQGFRDAMYGVYGKMATTPLYGEALSYGFLDKIGQVFVYRNSENIDYKIVQFDYLNAEVRSQIDLIWSNQYEAISYVNSVINQAGSTTLKDPDLHLIQGEAYGLRAFLHFDLLRLFAEDYRNKPNARGIPYAYTFDLKNKKLLSLKEVYAAILEDLSKAESLLSDDNSISLVTPNTDVTYRDDRFIHFNKFAVLATRARVYYAMGDMANAAKYAEMVISSTANFTLTTPADFTAVRRFSFGQKELIFGLYTTRLNQTVFDLFLRNSGSGNYTEPRNDLAELYNTKRFAAGNTDVRYSQYYASNGDSKFIRLLSNESEMTSNPLKGITLIRLPEMYYIYAEAMYMTDKPKAIAALEMVRKSRGLAPLDPSLIDTFEKFEMELRNEWMREFPGEGQIIYALKHYNMPFKGILNNQEITPNSKIFVLPWPQRELDYGNK